MMKNEYVFEDEVIFTYSDFDAYDHILPASLQRLFQDTAGKQCLKLGVGYEDMLAQDALWIVSKMQIVFLGDILYGEKYIIKTWPLKKRMFYFPREFIITKEDGTPIVTCISTWHIFSASERKIINPKDINLNGIECVDSTAENFESWNIDIDKEYESRSGELRLNHEVVFSELDHNGHMNNTHYSSLAIDSLKNHHKEEKLEEMRLFFLNECPKGTFIKTYAFDENDLNIVRGERDDSPVFIAVMKYGERK